MITQCRSCRSTDLTPVVDLGHQRISDFRDDPSPPPTYPLRLLLCQDCTLAQLDTTVPRELLYTDRYGYRSGVNPGIVADLADVAQYALREHLPAKRWLDIASNDGTLLSHVPHAIYRVGVDPVTRWRERAERHANWIVPDYFDSGVFLPGYFGIVTSVSMFYDIDNLNAFVGQVDEVLDRGGIWVIQQNSAAAMLAAGAVDNISHEHLTYFSLTSLIPLLQRHDMQVVDVVTGPVNGGVIRTLVSRVGDRTVRPSVAAQLAAETEAGVADPDAWRAFAARAHTNLERLAATVREAGKDGPVYIYGASTRGAVLWQAAGLTADDLPYAVERQPEKVGKWFSPIGSRIISEEQARHDQPAAMLIGPWWFADQFAEREREYLDRGGKLIVPLPEVRVISR